MATTLTATFSHSAGGGGLIAVTPASDGYDVVATSRPGSDANPLRALRAMGYRLADPSQRHTLGDTMAATGYAKLYVVASS